MKRALITGITGQDGSYLAEFLLDKGYEVHGIVRRVALEDPKHRFWRIQHILDRVTIHPASLESFPSLYSVITKLQPDECYHLAAQSFVSYSFDDAFSTFNANINGTLFVLDALRNTAPDCKFYFAGSSEMFGKVRHTPQTEETPFHPRSPYGISKSAGFDITRNFRESYDMFAVNGILFNHESPRRGYEFVTRKITHTAARIKLGLEKKLHLGNLDAKRAWGFAGDYVQAMWMMLQQEEPEDFVVATNETHSVQEFVEAAFGALDLRWEDHVAIDEQLYRPAEVNLLQGDYANAQRKLGWEPQVRFEELVRMMVEYDLEAEKALGG